VIPRATNTGVGGGADTALVYSASTRVRRIAGTAGRDSVLRMRIVVLALVCAFLWLVPAGAQAQTSPGTGGGSAAVSGRGAELALGPHLIWREHSSGAHAGGGLTGALGSGRAAGVIEASGTRRDGHNDWRALGGARVTLFDAVGTRLFLQGLAGTLIRSGKADLALMPGLGLDIGRSGARAVRLQVDVPIERSQGRTSTGARASIWLVVSPLGR